ncbi:MAG: hypothetical protein LJE97_10950 [Betaproteobacteria bacterium]|nr:hypothetical protein [Betaproteobacteria bacterium]
MRLDQIAVALAAALIAASPGMGSAWEYGFFPEDLRPSCTAELQKCLEKREKLALQLGVYGRAHDWGQIENALLRLNETDPQCAQLLQGMGRDGF